VAKAEGDRISKRVRAERRRRLARRRRLGRRLRSSVLLAALALGPIVWGIDCSGPEEIVNAEVVRTQRWRHVSQQAGAHVHIRATLLIEGRNEEVVDRADAFQRGQWVPVWIRRGRVSGWPYFQDLAQAQPGGAEASAAEESPAPAEELGQADELVPAEEVVPSDEAALAEQLAPGEERGPAEAR
jgi:hypothetical protein